MVRIRGGERVGHFMEFMNPGKPLSDWSRQNLRDSDGNLLTDAWLASKRPYEEVLHDALNFLGDTLIVGGQNCNYDVGVMLHSLRRMGQAGRWKVTSHVDSLFVAKAVMLGQPDAPDNFKLETLNRHFGLPEFAAHDAAEDSYASWLVLRATLQRGHAMQEQGACGHLLAAVSVASTAATCSPMLPATTGPPMSPTSNLPPTVLARLEANGPVSQNTQKAAEDAENLQKQNQNVARAPTGALVTLPRDSCRSPAANVLQPSLVQPNAKQVKRWIKRNHGALNAMYISLFNPVLRKVHSFPFKIKRR
jgi:DNA polymerase III epsilon subunit-like protein